MVSGVILDPTEIGSDLTAEEVMDGIGFIFESAKTVKLDEEAVMTQLTNYRAKAGAKTLFGSLPQILLH